MHHTPSALLARKTEDGRTQTLRAHCMAVAGYAAQTGAGFGMPALMRLCGLLHDMGKVSHAFQAYLAEGNRQKRGTVSHAPQGAVFARARWGRSGGKPGAPLTADLIAIAICAHHGKLPDLLNSTGDAFLEDALLPTRFDTATEGEPLPVLAARFYEAVAPEAELDALFEAARAETFALVRGKLADTVSALAAQAGNAPSTKARNGLLGLLQRSIFSALIDADRWDAYRFEAGLGTEAPMLPPWDAWAARLESKLAGFSRDKPIDHLRAAIAEECLSHGGDGAGTYRLRVPTGGGKTFSSLRFALAAARQAGMERVVYAAPYKTILEQTAQEFRTVLGQEDFILEHHSDVVFEPEEGKNADQGEKLRRYELFTQRWNRPLVLTTMVQLLNTLYAGSSASVRRFAALSKSVIILDEVQCIPVSCWYLVTLAIRYLTDIAGCAVVLCTATQPLWEKLKAYPLPTPIPMIRDEERLYQAFRRVRLRDRTGEGAFPPERLADEVLQAQQTAGSALCILNTKATALALYEALSTRKPAGVPLYCLTTYQCPAHRLRLLNEIRERLAARQPVLCVATQLIEAGVDVSFGLTVRALAGLESVTQAAGRCNRHGERGQGELGEVWLVCVAEEKLGSLQQIADAQQRTRFTLAWAARMPAAAGEDLLSPAVLEGYFKRLINDEERKGTLRYPLTSKNHGINANLIDLLGSNDMGRGAYKDRHAQKEYPGNMAQAFATAGRYFTPLDACTYPVLTPWGEGARIICQLQTETDIRTTRALLRQAQPYSVAVYKHDLDLLLQNHALSLLPDASVYVLAPAYYQAELGLTTQRQFMEPLYS